MNETICKICKKPYHKNTMNQKYCCRTCATVAANMNSKIRHNKHLLEEEPVIPKSDEEMIKEVRKEKRSYKYCPLNCSQYATCKKRGHDEFEYIWSGGGRIRAIKGCDEDYLKEKQICSYLR